MNEKSGDSAGVWPDYFPDDVPPWDAVAASGTVFRLVSAVPPPKGDFQSTFETNPRNYGADMWRACGTSLHGELEHCVRTRKRYKALRAKRIAVGVLIESFGVMKGTPNRTSPSHITVWFRVASKPHEAFTTDAEQP